MLAQGEHGIEARRGLLLPPPSRVQRLSTKTAGRRSGKASDAGAADYQAALTDLGTLGGNSSQALGIDDAGDVVGSSYLAPASNQESGGTSHGFVAPASKSGLNDLGSLRTDYILYSPPEPIVGNSLAQAISPSGDETVGWSETNDVPDNPDDPQGMIATTWTDQGQDTDPWSSDTATALWTFRATWDDGIVEDGAGCDDNINPNGATSLSRSTGVNDAGVVVGVADEQLESCAPPGSPPDSTVPWWGVAFRWDGPAQGCDPRIGLGACPEDALGNFDNTPNPEDGCAYSQADAVNASGEVVGFSGNQAWGGWGACGPSTTATTAGGVPPFIGHAFMMRSGGSSGDMVDLGEPAGGTGTDNYSEATAVNDSGEIAVNAMDNSGIVHGYLYDDGTFTNVGSLGGSTWMYGINSAGDMVGESLADDGVPRAVAYLNGRLIDLNSLLPAGSGWFLETAHGINNNMEVAGTGVINGSQHAFRMELCAVCITGVQTQTQSVGTGDWVAVPDNTTYDGNVLRFAVAVTNRTADPQNALLQFTDQYDGVELPDSTRTVALAPGATTTVTYDWNTTGLAWSGGLPTADHPIQLQLTDGNSGSSTQTIHVTIAPRPVILVHGLWSNYATWSKYQSFLTAVNPYWRAYAVGDGQAPGTLNTGSLSNLLHPWSAAPYTIGQNAQILAQYIAGVRDATNAWHVDIVGHSMGGLISRWYIQNDMPESLDNNPVVTHLVMLGTPNEGSPCANVLGGIDGIDMEQLTPQYEAWFNQVVTEQNGVPFSLAAGDPFSTDPKAELLFATTCGYPEPGDTVVPIQSALWTLTDTALYPVIHTDMPSSQSMFTGFVVPHLTAEPGSSDSDMRGEEVSTSGPPALMLGADSDEPAGGQDPFRSLTADATTGSGGQGDSPQLESTQTVTIPANGTTDMPISAGNLSELGFAGLVPPTVGSALIDPTGASSDQVAASSPEAAGGVRVGQAADPMAGTWQVQLTNSAGSPQAAIISTTVTGSPIMLTFTPGTANSALEVPLKATLTNGAADVTGAQVSVQVAAVSGGSATQITQISLRDQGDGTYTGTTAPLPGGWYSALVTATTSTFKRLTTGMIHVVAPPAGPANSVSVDLTPSSLTADGTATTVATATVKDADANPVAGDHVVFTSTDPGDDIGAVTDNGDGTYTATITASTVAGTPTITATDQSTSPAVSGTATLTETAGLAKSLSVVLTPSSIVADGSATTVAAATVDDADGNPVSGARVAFGSTDPGDRIGPVTDNGDGTYTATVTASTVARSAFITATDESASPAVFRSATLIEEPGRAASVSVALDPASLVADGHSFTVATATVKDANGNPVAGDHLVFSSTDPGDLIGSVNTPEDGIYTATVTASTRPGTPTITATDESNTPALSSTAPLTETAGSGTGVTEQQLLVPADQPPDQNGSGFGDSVALSADGTTAVIGRRSAGGDGTGAVDVETLDGSTWVQQAELVPDDNQVIATGTNFGASVALSSDGNTALIGGPEDNEYQGGAWIYTRSNGQWTEQAHIVPPDELGRVAGIASSQFGTSVGLSPDGNTAVISGPYDYGAGDQYGWGAVWIYTRTGTTWTEQAKLSPADEINTARFGDSVALASDSNILLIGGDTDDGDRGSAWVYTEAAGSWSEAAKFSPSDEIAVGSPHPESEFGASVALSSNGTTAVVGGPNDDADKGATWVYTATSGTWNEEAKIVPPDETPYPGQASADAEFGSQVSESTDGTNALIGGPEDGALAGAAWLYARANGTWTEVTKIGPPADANNGTTINHVAFGSAIALSSDATGALIGGPQNEIPDPTDPTLGWLGAVWAFQISPGQSEKTTTNTSLTGARQVGATINVPAGSPVTDQAMIVGANAGSATGTISYNVYSDAQCTDLVSSGTTQAIATPGSPPASTPVILKTPGTYYWKASYSGDGENEASTSRCGSEVETVLAPTAMSTSLGGDGQGGTSVTVGPDDNITDSASLTGTDGSATGTVTYTVYSDSACTDTVRQGPAQPVTTPGALPTSPPVSLTTPGTYYWQATYSGDGQNQASGSNCGSEVETVLGKQPTSLSTALTATGKSGATLTVTPSTPVTDSASLSSADASSVTGTVTYNVYSDSSCTSPVSQGSPQAISTPGRLPASGPVSLSSPGTYYWQASYSGDSQNENSVSLCGGEVETVLAPTTLTISLADGGAPTSTGLTIGPANPGAPLTPTWASAALTGKHAATATGTVTYSVYSNSACTGLVLDGSAEAIATAGALPASPPVSLPGPGTYYWQASYSGDRQNESSLSPCESEVEIVLAATGIASSLTGGGQAGANITVDAGTPVSDSATLSGKLAPKAIGHVTYTVFSDSKCTVEVGQATAEKISTPGLIPPSQSVSLSSPGTYYWEVLYSGDNENQWSASHCGSAVETVRPPASTGSIGKPVVITPPTITGTPLPGRTITCTDGRWTGTPTQFTYQWYRDGVAIEDATEANYVVQIADEAQTLSCGVTATGPGGSATAQSKGVLVAVAATLRCAKPTGRLRETTVGPLRLGMTRARARRTLTPFHVQKSNGFDDFCLYAGWGIRVGYPSALLMRTMTEHQRVALRGRIVIALTANPFYALHGVRPGAKLSAVARTLRVGRPFHIGRNYWYFAPGTPADGVLKVRYGIIQEVGLANRGLLHGRTAQRLFMASFRSGSPRVPGPKAAREAYHLGDVRPQGRGGRSGVRA
jgi:pimeloyl-ACP methyl ester carboxylesterase